MKRNIGRDPLAAELPQLLRRRHPAPERVRPSPRQPSRLPSPSLAAHSRLPTGSVTFVDERVPMPGPAMLSGQTVRPQFLFPMPTTVALPIQTRRSRSAIASFNPTETDPHPYGPFIVDNLHSTLQFLLDGLSLTVNPTCQKTLDFVPSRT